jgi:hypothetical protein
VAKLFIDFGGTTCIGRCQHCRFGTKDASGPVEFSLSSKMLLERLIRYAQAHETTVRLAYLNNLLAMPELPGVASGVDTLSISLSSLSEVQNSGQEIVERTKAFSGSAIEVNLNHYNLTDFKIEQDFEAVFALQRALFAAFPRLRDVYFGLNHNTSTEAVSTLALESMFAAHVYVQGMEYAFRKTGDFGESEIIQTRLGEILQQRALVHFGDYLYSFGCRYVLAHDAGTAARTELPMIKSEKLCVAILSHGVHIGHTTFTINNPLYWFSHEEFGYLINQAESEGESLSAACLAALELRRSLKTV